MILVVCVWGGGAYMWYMILAMVGHKDSGTTIVGSLILVGVWGLLGDDACRGSYVFESR